MLKRHRPKPRAPDPYKDHVHLLLHEIDCKLENIMVAQTQHASELTALKAQVAKTRAETLKRFADLEAAQGQAGNTTPEVDEAMAALKAEIQGSDDVIADEQA